MNCCNKDDPEKQDDNFERMEEMMEIDHLNQTHTHDNDEQYLNTEKLSIENSNKLQ